MKSIHPEIEELRERLRAAPVTLRQVAEETGLTWHWLRAFTEKRTLDPGYSKVETLRGYLDQLDKAA